MNYKEKIRKQQRKNMLYSLMAFVVIFSLVGIILYQLINYFIFSSVDHNLQWAAENIHGIISMPPSNSFPGGPPNQNKPDSNNLDNPQSAYKNFTMNDNLGPRLMLVMKNGNDYDFMGNAEQFENFVHLLFTKEPAIIYNITVESLTSTQLTSHYRTIIAEVPLNEQTILVQLLVNIDGEYEIANNLFIILTITLLILILLSLTASFILSKKNMQPIIKTWIKQSEFLQNASHELRTPLTIIQSKLEMMLTKPNAKIIDEAQNIQLAMSETKRLSKLTTDLMVLARSDSMEMELKQEVLQINDLLEKMAQPYMEMAQLQEKKIWMELKSKGKVYGDSEKLHQVFVIILDNALKYTEKNDSICIMTEDNENRIRITIYDTGIGMSEQSIHRAFDRFYREDKARTRKKGGSGLGLSIAEHIVHLHQGKIKIEHNQPKGVKILITLPKMI